MKPVNHAQKSGWLFCPSGRKLNQDTDVFFLYPTVYIHPGKKRHNMSPRHLIYRFFAWFLTVWRGRVFADSCNVFTPHYRQAGIEILDMAPEQAAPYIETAYTDVRNAFLYYMEHLNDSRPFILAGHSQGSEQLLELMKREFADGKYAGRFIGAYLIGYSVTKDDLEQYPQLRLVGGEADLGGIVTYNTSAAGLRLMKVVRPGAVCVNPLNWKTTAEYAPKSRNIGSVLFDFGKYFRIERKHFTGAYIDTKQGVLMIDSDALNKLLHVRIAFLNRILMRRGTLHMLDIALFHRNLQKSVHARIQRYFEQNPKTDRERFGPRHGEISGIVKQVVRRFDPMGLLQGGAPVGAYEMEVGRIAPSVIRQCPKRLLASHIRAVFTESFDTEFPRKKAARMAKEILRAARKVAY